MGKFFWNQKNRKKGKKGKKARALSIGEKQRRMRRVFERDDRRGRRGGEEMPGMEERTSVSGWVSLVEMLALHRVDQFIEIGTGGISDVNGNTTQVAGCRLDASAAFDNLHWNICWCGLQFFPGKGMTNKLVQIFCQRCHINHVNSFHVIINIHIQQICTVKHTHTVYMSNSRKERQEEWPKLSTNNCQDLEEVQQSSAGRMKLTLF